MLKSLAICLIVSVCRVFAIAEPPLSSLESRIVELEKRDQLLIQIIQDQATNIRDLELSNSAQAQVIKDIQAELETLKRSAPNPDTKQPSDHHKDEHPFYAFSHENKALKSKDHDQSVSSPVVHSERARKFLLNGAETVAFHANFPDDAHILHHAAGTPIEFSNVFLNVGGGYHPSTSLFIAPMSGIYIFSASIMSSLMDVGKRVHAGIMKNGTYLAGIYANRDGVNGGEQGSVTIATQLSLGDEVWVQHLVHTDGTIYGGGLTSFMGCLISPL